MSRGDSARLVADFLVRAAEVLIPPSRIALPASFSGGVGRVGAR
jgi:hypothetical protein